MSTTYVEIEDKYQPIPEGGNIEVTVNLGDGQPGAYLIFLNQDLKGANVPAKIGTSTEVLGKRTIVSATITDVLDETNWTSVTVNVKQGTSVKTYGPYSKQVPKNLDTVCYIIKISNTND